MPTAIARIERERRVETLARNLYVIQGRGRSADLERAVRALLRANPGLGEASGFRRGAVVRVPVDVGLPLSNRVERRSAGPEGPSKEAVQRLELGAQHLRESAAASNRAAEAALGRLKDRRFVTALRKAAPRAAELVPEATQSLEQRVAANKETQAALEKATEEAIAQIERLQRLAEGKED